MALVTVLVAVALDRAWSDLRFVPVPIVWPLFSLMMSTVTVWALLLEARARPARWNTSAGTGVVSRGGALDVAGEP